MSARRSTPATLKTVAAGARARMGSYVRTVCVTVPRKTSPIQATADAAVHVPMMKSVLAVAALVIQTMTPTRRTVHVGVHAQMGFFAGRGHASAKV